MTQDDLIGTLDEDVRGMCRAHLDACAAEGIVLRVTQAFRSFEEQAGLWAMGRDKPGRIVTNAKPGWSWHNWRRAYDVAIVTYEGDTTPLDVYDGPWTRVGELGEKCGLEWGGRWKHLDLPHFENRAGKTLAGLLAEHPQGLA